MVASFRNHGPYFSFSAHSEVGNDRFEVSVKPLEMPLLADEFVPLVEYDSGFSFLLNERR